MSTPKQQVEAVLSKLPDDCSLEEIQAEVAACANLQRQITSWQGNGQITDDEYNQDADRIKKALEADPEWQTLITKIRTRPPNPDMIRPAQGSLADYLAASIASEDPNEEFDLAEWTRNWNAIEAEMKEIETAKAITEGLG